MKPIKWLLKKAEKRKISLDEEIAIRNSFFQTLTNVTAKIGSIIFTVILARVLLPETFGLYSLVLSTVLIFAALSDFGVNQTITRFISKDLSGKNYGQAKSHFVYLAKIKISLILLSMSLIFLTAKIISQSYYNKPIFLAMIIGSFYVLFSGMFVILKSVFEALNDFKTILYQEILFQVTRVVITPLIAFFALKFTIGAGVTVAYVIAGLTLAYLFSLAFFIINYGKIPFLKENYQPLAKKQKSSLRKFVIASSAMIFSGIFFSNVDRVMLGYFVDPEFIGYYAAAFTFIFASTQLVSFSSALLPVFSRRNIGHLDRIYEKSRKLVFFLSVAAFLLFFIFSNVIIKVLYGEEYIPAVNILRIFSLILIFLPMISLSSTYILAIGKPQIVSRILIISMIINVALNYILISELVVFGQLFGVYGAVIATLVSHFFYLILLTSYKKKL
jgi:O-antigen/teichoic acid export membrane protein